MTDRKKIRQITGYTHGGQLANADSWFRSAKGFHYSAALLNEFADRIPSDTRPFALNAALSLELIFKAILARKQLPIPDDGKGHDLRLLRSMAKIDLTNKQMATLELLTETLVWAGRYPAPKKEEKWDDYNDRILEKHVVRTQKGNMFSAMANPETFPDWSNYKKIWDRCVAEFGPAP
jgi:hypothetical protein